MIWYLAALAALCIAAWALHLAEAGATLRHLTSTPVQPSPGRPCPACDTERPST